MSYLRRSPAGRLGSLVKSVFQRAKTGPGRRFLRLSGGERFEHRRLLALTVESIATPAVGSVDVDLGTDLVFTFSENVQKGQGRIYVVEQATGEAGVSVSVRDDAVTVAGNQVSIDLPVDLLPDNTYSISIDPGAFIDTSTTPTAAATLLTQSFDFINLDPFVTETGGDGSDYSTTPQFGFELESTLNPELGVAEWRGWSFADKDAWITAAGNQSRDQFELGDGTLLISDSDEYDDANSPERPWVGYSYTPEIDLTGVAPNSVRLEFDSSFRPENPRASDGQLGTLEVTFDGGLSWTELLRLDGDNTSNNGSNAVSANINERLVSGTATGLSGDGKGGVSFGAVDNPSTGSMQFRWFVEGTNDWWWAIDDILVTGDIVGVPYEGLTDQTVWTFSTPESPRFTLSLDAAAISENGGTATATLSRNAGPLVPDGEVVVSLASSDETELTVPATVTIPAGQLSVTFPVTAVDDGEADRTQTVTIEAVAAPFTSGTTSLLVTDDEGPKVVSVVPGDGLTDVDYRSDLTITFDREVVKGAGIIRLVAAADGEQVVELDVASTDVLVSGATMTITLPDLPGETEYQILMDDGVVVSTSSDLYSGVILMEENFDTLPLLDFADSLVGPDLGDGTDYTFQNPLGFTIDNSLMATGGSSPFEGWSYMDKNSWIAEQGDQSRSKFTLGSGTVAVADGDAWDDYPHDEGYMTSFLITRPIDLTGITPGSVSLEFDSSYYHELPQFASVHVSYDGVTFSPLLFFGDETVPGIGDGSSRNERIVVDSSSQFNDIIGSSIVDSSLDNPGFGTLQFMFRYENAGNNWWWAVDNIVIRGERAGEPFAGLEADSWSFTTGPAPTLSVSFDAATIAETGSATGTVTRTVDLASELVVFLASSDPTAATVPATVTIPAGEASATFAITAFDDFVTDGNQETEISVTADGFFAGSATMTVADDDFPQLIAATPAAGATGAAVDGPLTLTFDQNVRAGSGFITIVDSASGAAVESISINSSAVAIVDATVTVTRSVRLAGQTAYHVRIDPAAILATAPGVSDGVPLLRQDFELLPLGPAVTESGGDGTDWTAEPPSGWTVDNTDMPAGGVPEYAGWTFVDKDTWNVWSGQGRDAFTLASGTVAVADTDEFDDSDPDPEGPFNSTFITPLIPLQAVAGGDVTIEFDSSFRPEGGGGGAADGNQTGIVEVSFDGGATWTNLLTQDGDTSDGSLNDPSVNRRESLTAAIPSAATAMQVRFGQEGSNDYWWAIDNVSIIATTISPPYPGISDTSLAFTTEDATAQPAIEAASFVGGTAAADVSAPITLSFNQPMRAGNGFLRIVDLAAGVAVASFNVNSDVTFSGNDVVITPPAPLGFDTAYAVRVDPGALLTVASENRSGVPLMVQDFELLPLGPAVTESGGDGTDWTATPPADWLVDNSGLAAGGVPEYAGWTFVDKETWNFWSGQGRDSFTLAGGTVAVADTDEFEDSNPKPEGALDSLLVTPAIDLTTVTSSSATIEFDSSFRPEGGGGGFADGNQTGVVEVSFDDGATWTNLLTLDGNNADGSLADTSVNRREVLTVPIFAGAETMHVRWGQQGTNDYWWAIDNVRISADVDRWAFEGVTDDTSITFTTATGSVGNETIVDVGSGQTVTDTTVHAGDAVIVKTGEGTLILDLANSHSGGLRVDAGEVVIRNAAAVNGGPLTVAAGAKLTLDTGVSRIDVSALAVDPAGQIDLGRAGLVIAAGGIDPAELRAAIVAGRNGGTWDGSGGISSTTAAATAGRAVGYAPGGNGTTVVAFAALGDADLNGQVNVLDLVAMDSSGSFNSGGPAEWYQGDFDYSGGTNAFDLIALDSGGAFGAGDYNQAPASALTAATDTGDEQPGPLVPGSKLSVSQMAFASLADEAGKDEEEQWPRIV